MAIFNWHSIYSVNHDVIDGHHKEIIALFNRLYENFTEQNLETYESTLEELTSVLACHFSVEEQYMTDIHYQDKADHSQKHEAFSQRLQTLKQTCITDKNESCRELIYSLGFWVLNHETDEDKKMVAELANYQRAA